MGTPKAGDLDRLIACEHCDAVYRRVAVTAGEPLILTARAPLGIGGGIDGGVNAGVVGAKAAGQRG